MTPAQADRVRALSEASMLPGDPGKRFVRDLCQALDGGLSRDLSVRQDAWLARLAWRHRRQLPRAVVPERKPT